MSATPDSTFTNPEQRIADLERQLAEREAELAECNAERDAGLERETATAEVLGVINSSPGDLTPVFDAIFEKAMHLCGAGLGFLTRVEGENFNAVALRGVPPGFAEIFRQPQRIVPGQAHYSAMQGADVIHIEDITTEDVYRSGDPARRALADIGGARTGLLVALRKDGALLGAIVIYRKEVRPFTDKQIALLRAFASQAVIAMENARLINETREALEQQTATAEVLQVINSSPGDLKPVFDAILEKAHSLCGAEHGVLLTYDGELLWRAAVHGAPAGFPESWWREGIRPRFAFAELVRGERFLYIHDMVEYAVQRPNEPTPRRLVVIAKNSYGEANDCSCLDRGKQHRQ